MIHLISVSGHDKFPPNFSDGEGVKKRWCHALCIIQFLYEPTLVAPVTKFTALPIFLLWEL